MKVVIKMEVIVIGGIAAGMSVAAKAARTNKNARITVIEKENFISFGACGLPYYIGNQFSDAGNMFARTPEQMEDSGINLMLEHEVINLDFSNKILQVKNLKTNEIFNKNYDKLMIATGATPIIPEIFNKDVDNIYTITKLAKADKLKANLSTYNNVAVIGGGFIGVEVAEQLAHLGKKVSLIESQKTVLSSVFDTEISENIYNALSAKGIKVLVDESVESLITELKKITEVVTTKQKIAVDAVVIAVGFKPATSFIQDKALEKFSNGAIIIDKFGRTTIKDVFAAGDCATVYHQQLGNIYLPLATTANKLGRLIGVNIVSDESDYEEFIGTLGSCAIKVGDFEAGRTGLTEHLAREKGIKYGITTVQANNHTNYWAGQTKITMKLVYEKDTKVLLGAQVFGKSDAVLRLTGLTTAIHAKLTTKEIGFIDYAYAPPFSSTWEAINVVANTAK